MVALRKESVDRNLVFASGTLASPGSLSARRAWIEIMMTFPCSPASLSLSARRAWIEML